MSETQDRLNRLGPKCVHFNSRAFITGDGDGRDACARGLPIRKLVIEANGNDNLGIVFKTPCKPGPECVMSCGGYEQEGPEELRKRQEETKKAMDAATKIIAKASVWREKMIKAGKRTGRASCPACGGHRTVLVNIALGYNNHIHASCQKCNAGFME